MAASPQARSRQDASSRSSQVDSRRAIHSKDGRHFGLLPGGQAVLPLVELAQAHQEAAQGEMPGLPGAGDIAVQRTPSIRLGGIMERGSFPRFHKGIEAGQPAA